MDIAGTARKEETLQDSDQVFLRPEVKLEPLVYGWYAWIHLVSPIQHALNIVYRHLPLLQSFEKNPTVHVGAKTDPSLFGGPFVDFPAERMSDIQALIAGTQNRYSRLIAMAQELKQLDKALQEKAKGFALDDMFSLVPASLAGLVEFVYDINNHPRIRFHEPLVYDEYFDRQAQQIYLSLTKEEERPFFMSTPRMESDDSVVLSVPFADSRIDRLSSLRTNPAAMGDVAAMLEVTDAQRHKFSRLFTCQRPPSRWTKPRDNYVRVRYFGHACVLIETASTSILVDPMLCWETAKDDGRFTFFDLPERLDYVVLSHGHHDHCALEILLQLRSRIGRVVVPRNNSGSVADPSMELALRHSGIQQIHVMDQFDELVFAGGKIVSLPFLGEHCDLDIYSKHGIHIEINGRRFAFHIDSNGMDPTLFSRIAKRLGKKLDAIFIGMECRGGPLSWLYGPLHTNPISRKNDESRRLSGLDATRAQKVIQQFEAERVFIYAMGQEPWLKFIMGLEYTPESVQMKEIQLFLEQCERTNVNAERLFISKELVLNGIGD